MWLYWLDKRWHEMSLTDYYLLAVATEVRRSYSKTPSKVKMEDLKLKFESKVKPIVRDKEIISKISQARWFAITGYKPDKDKP